MSSENFPNGDDEHQKNSDEENTQAAMSYFLLLAPVLYLNRKDSEFIRFHAKQGTVLLIFFVAFWLLGDIHYWVFSIFSLLNFGVVGLAALGFIKALRGEKYNIPLVSEISQNGLSPEKIWKGTKKAGKISGNLVIGFLPKKTGDKISQKLKISPDDALIARIENIEKVLIQDKFLRPEISQKIGDLAPQKKQFFADVIHYLQGLDSNTKIHEESTFLEISGNFGMVIVGGVKNTDPENFSYAVSLVEDCAQKISLPKNSLTFGGFEVGTLTIGEEFLK